MSDPTSPTSTAKFEAVAPLARFGNINLANIQSKQDLEQEVNKLVEERRKLDAEWERLDVERKELEEERKRLGLQYKLFVGNLSKSTTPADVRPLFEPFGAIKEIVQLKDRDGQSKRSCFVVFHSKSAADKALLALNGRLKDKSESEPLVVRYARDKSGGGGGGAGGGGAAYNMSSLLSTGSLSSYPYASSSSSSSAGNANAGSMSPNSASGLGLGLMGTGSMGTGMGMGMGMTMGSMGMTPMASTPASASALPSTSTVATANTAAAFRPITAFPPRQDFGGYRPSSSRGPPGANLYVNNISRTATEEDVRRTFAEFGTVLSVKVFPQGYGFVSFDTVAAAEAATSVLNGTPTADGKMLEVSTKKDKSNRFAPY